MTDSERQQILKMIEDGKISPEQGLVLMQALEEAPDDETGAVAELPGDASAPGAVEVMAAPGWQDESGEAHTEHRFDPEFDRKINRYRSLWVIPLWIGIAVTVAGAWWMYSALQSGGMGFWFFFAWIPFLLGVLLIALGFASRTSRWIYVNVQQKPGASPQRIVVAFPLAWVSWIMKFVKNSPGMRDNPATEDIMNAVFEGTNSDGPLFVDVNDEDGEHVQVYIG